VRLTEIRAVWVSNTDRLDWDRATRDLQRAGFNTMYVNFASGGAAFYPSALVPQVNTMSGDPIAAAVALAHQRGLQVHAKLIATFMFKTTPEFQKKLLAANRVMRGPTGKPIDQAGYLWLCPTQESNRTVLVGLAREMITRYPVDGFHLDYIRFSEQPSCYCAVCRQQFERSLGQKTDHWPHDVIDDHLVLRFKAWQQQVINDSVRELTAAVQNLRPQLARSAAVFSDLPRAREEKAQDWKLWLDSGYVDYVCPMNYVPSLAEFQTQLRQQQQWAGSSRRIVAGIGSWKFDQPGPLWAQINAARQAGAYGFALFSYDDAAERGFLPNLAAAAR
jgi:uncharacterized lipoprotein YddW (UPF0748 family)